MVGAWPDRSSTGEDGDVNRGSEDLRERQAHDGFRGAPAVNARSSCLCPRLARGQRVPVRHARVPIGNGASVLGKRPARLPDETC